MNRIRSGTRGCSPGLHETRPTRRAMSEIGLDAIELGSVLTLVLNTVAERMIYHDL